jgi:hypothetical protein
MADEEHMTERHGRVLAELTELGLELARDLQARGLAAEDAKAAADLSLAFHRVARSVRQTVALEARLERDRQRLAREARSDLQRETRARVQQRKAQLGAAVRREIWTEAEGEEAERLLDDLDDWLDEESLADGFAVAPIEAHIERIRADLGLPPPPPPPPEPEGAATPTVTPLQGAPPSPQPASGLGEDLESLRSSPPSGRWIGANTRRDGGG